MDRQARNRRYYEAHREQILEDHRQYREANREAINEASRERHHRQYAANPEKEREQSRRYYAAHRGQALEQNRQRRKANPEKERQKHRRYYEAHHEQILEQKRQQNRQYTIRLRATIFRRYGEMCACCGSTERLTIDHVNGGGGEHRRAIGIKTGSGRPFYQWLVRMYLPPGYQALCASCNASKKNSEHCRLDHTGAASSG